MYETAGFVGKKICEGHIDESGDDEPHICGCVDGPRIARKTM